MPLPWTLPYFTKGWSSWTLAGSISQPRSFYQQQMSWKIWKLTVLEPVMGSDSDFDFQQFIPASAAKAALVLPHPETQAFDMRLIWEFPSQGSTFSTSIYLVQWHWEQPSNVITFPNLLRSSERISYPTRGWYEVPEAHLEYFYIYFIIRPISMLFTTRNRSISVFKSKRWDRARNTQSNSENAFLEFCSFYTALKPNLQESCFHSDT